MISSSLRLPIHLSKKLPLQLASELLVSVALLSVARLLSYFVCCFTFQMTHKLRIRVLLLLHEKLSCRVPGKAVRDVWFMVPPHLPAGSAPPLVAELPIQLTTAPVSRLPPAWRSRSRPSRLPARAPAAAPVLLPLLRSCRTGRVPPPGSAADSSARARAGASSS